MIYNTHLGKTIEIESTPYATAGGQAEVYKVSGKNKLAKIYHSKNGMINSPTKRKKHYDKLFFMINNPPFDQKTDKTIRVQPKPPQ